MIRRLLERELVMRDKMIGYSVLCCFVLGAIYLKNKVFNKRLVEETTEPENLSEQEQNQ
jgi:hypothetical protein